MEFETEAKYKLMEFFGEGEVFTDAEWNEFEMKRVEFILSEWEFHGNRKKALGHRVQVLRVLVRTFHDGKRIGMNENEFNARCESYLDKLLRKYDYRIEEAINHLRKVRSTWNVVGIL